MVNPVSRFYLQPGGRLRGQLRVPGDKSISHRAIMLGAIAEGDTQISGFLEGEDCIATLNAFRAMGVDIEGPNEGRVIIHGVGKDGLKLPSEPLDLGNSGTSMRLLAGLLSGQNFEVVLTGDDSLVQRPMRRVTDPLTQMGARIAASSAGTPPLMVRPAEGLKGIDYNMPVASAQVKSCLLLAGLYARGTTCVIEPALTRDHTERMLTSFGYPVVRRGNRICVEGGGCLAGTSLDVPADISSAAFFMVGASIAEDSELMLTHVGVNPSRVGVIEILKRMGADIQLLNESVVGGEPVADIRVRSAPLKGIEVPSELVPLAIDEFPVLFIAAACAKGRFVLRGAQELRVKESDRIAVMAEGLQKCGIRAEPTPDGIVIEGGRLAGGVIHSYADHRIAMSFAISSLGASMPIEIEGTENVSTSFPEFPTMAYQLGLQIFTSG